MDPDPWDWTIADVQAFFRDQAAEHINDLPHGRLPVLEPFLASLDALEVDGYTLLHHIDVGILRNDCGVKSLSVAGAVMRCIEKLRRHSTKYAAEHGLEIQPLLSTLRKDTRPEVPKVASARAAEVLIEDERGRKRRRLDLSSVQLPQPQLFETNIARPTSQALILPHSSTGYMPDASSTVDSMFFGRSAFGHVLEYSVDQDLFVSHVQCDAEAADNNFQFVRPSKSPGQCQLAGTRMRYFLSHTTPVELRRHGRPALAIMPYRDSVSSSSRAAMVVQFRDGSEPLAIKEHAFALDRGEAETEVPSALEAQGGEEWEYLTVKHRQGSSDEVFDAYGLVAGDDEPLSISDDENDDDRRGSESEAEESDGDPEVIPLDEVDRIIDEYVRDHIEQWRAKLPRLVKEKARSTWNKMKKSLTLRALLIQEEENKITLYNKRLAKFKAYMMEETFYTTDAGVRMQCAILNGTVEDRELSRWKISVWQTRQEPGRVVQPKQSRQPNKSNGGRSAVPSFVPDADDRLSYSPAIANQLELHENGVRSTDEEILYEADDEEFHTPEGSATMSAGAALDVGDPLDDFIVPDQETTETSSLKEQVHGILPPVDVLSESSFNPQSEHDASEEDEEGLPSPSQFVRSIKREAASKPPSTPAKPHGVEAIDLTHLPSSVTPKKRGRPLKDTSTPTVKRQDFNSDPLKATASEVDSWDLSERAMAKDRQRMLILLLRDSGEEIRNSFRDLLKRLLAPKFKAELGLACQALQTSGTWSSKLSENDLALMREARGLFLRWFFPQYATRQIKDIHQLDVKQLTDDNQMLFFTRMLQSILTKTALFADAQSRSSNVASFSAKLKSSARIGSSSAIPVVIPSSSDEAPKSQSLLKQSSPRKIRKRKVLRDEDAHKARKAAAERQQRFEESQGTDSVRLAAMVASDARSRIEINPVRDGDADPIYMINSIAQSIKPHQIDGVRFLWRELTAGGDDGEQGCILAHTMGLGKTMQAIAVLAALTHASHDHNERVYSQLPHHLCTEEVSKRQIRILILCPPSLISNWRREIDLWAYKVLGTIYSLDSTTNHFHLQHMEEWMRFGGVLLIGYQMFHRKATKRNKADSVSEESKHVREILLKGPEVVVADEAHHLKNQRSGIAVAANEIATESRIGLTGTPMSNDVQEIYSLVSFVAPGFLGEPVEFKAHYAEPIEQGLYHDSSYYEKRKSLMKLKVLHAEIQPKVNRANIEVLRGSLRPKVEFVLTVPLGIMQTELYRRTVAMLLRDGRSENASNVAFFGWLSVLTLLTNHPYCFRERLLAPPKKRNKRKSDYGEEVLVEDVQSPAESDAGGGSAAGRTDADASESDPYSEPVRALGFTEDIIASILDGLDTDSMDVLLSSKVAIFFELLDHCLACKDKVLVFSSNILTLDFLGLLLKAHHIRFGGFGRIDGQTPMHLRTNILERFHRDDFDIMLVSTKAGGVGLNIQGANRVFIFDFQFNPTHEEQAIGRAYRLGQIKPVFVYRFVAGGTFEQNIENKQMFKTSLAQRVVDKKNPKRYAEKNTREYLYPPKEVWQQGLEEWMGKDPHVLDKLLAQHGSGPDKKDTMIRAIKTMETLQEDAMDAPLDELEQKEVDDAILAGRNRPRGKKAVNYGSMVSLPQHMDPTNSQVNNGMRADVAGPSTQVVKLKTKNGWEPVSTQAANASKLPPAPSMGGLPFTNRKDSD